MMKAAIYARVSKDDGSQTPENQLAELRTFSAKQGWVIAREYVDQASAKSGDRDEFKRLFEDASRHKFDVVLFWALDRFSREGTLKTLGYLEKLNHAGVAWRSYSEAYLDSTSPFADVLIAFVATLAKQERVRLIERTKSGLARARREGKTLGRPKTIFRLDEAIRLRTQGMSWRQIAKELGVPSATIRDRCAENVSRTGGGGDGKQAA